MSFLNRLVGGIDPDPDKAIVDWTPLKAPKWVPDDTLVTTCKHCTVEFKKHHKHHCRLCGELFCSQCTGKFHLPMFFYKKKHKASQATRVCYGCVDACKLRANEAAAQEAQQEEQAKELAFSRSLTSPAGGALARGLTGSLGRLPSMSSLSALTTTSKRRGSVVDRSQKKMYIPIWQPRRTDGGGLRCYKCKAGCKGFNCRGCGRIFCGTHTNKMDMPPKFKKKGKPGLVRVCDACRYFIIGGAELIEMTKYQMQKRQRSGTKSLDSPQLGAGANLASLPEMSPLATTLTASMSPSPGLLAKSPGMVPVLALPPSGIMTGSEGEESDVPDQIEYSSDDSDAPAHLRKSSQAPSEPGSPLMSRSNRRSASDAMSAGSAWAQRQKGIKQRREAYKAREAEEAARTDVTEVTLADYTEGDDDEEAIVSVRWAHEGDTGRELLRATMGSRKGHLGHIVSKFNAVLPDIAPATHEAKCPLSFTVRGEVVPKALYDVFRAKVLAPIVYVQRGYTPQESGYDFDEEDAPWNLVPDADGKGIRAATINKLVEAVTDIKGTNLNTRYVFLLTYQSFMTPEELLDRLQARWDIPSPGADEATEEERLQFRKETTDKIHIRISSVIKNWIDEFYFADFADEARKAQLLALVTRMLQESASPVSRQLAHGIAKLIAKRDSMGPAAPKPFMAAKCPRPRINVDITPKQLQIEDVESIEIARQLALMDFQVFQAIQPREFLNQAWSRDRTKMALAPNIIAMIEQFNRVSSWVQETILQPTVSKRAFWVMKFLKIADGCRALNNFNSLFAIYCGLTANPIHRLKRTKEILKKKHETKMNALAELFSGAKNSKTFRETLQAAIPPCIPHLGIFLTDLTFIDDGNPDTVLGLINFQKQGQLAARIRWIKQYQQQGYSLTPVPALQDYLKGRTTKTEDELWELSKTVEPREAPQS